MLQINFLRGAGLGLLIFSLACNMARQTPQPGPELQQLAYEIQTATPTIPAVLSLLDESSFTPTPRFLTTATPTVDAEAEVEEAVADIPPDVEAPATAVESSPTAEPTATVAEPTPAPPTATPPPTVPPTKPLQGGEWDFEVDFDEWFNPHGEACAGSGLARGWGAFTTRDEYGSSCFNKTTWSNNVYIGGSAQEITFAYVGNQAGIYKSAPTIPGHRYTVEAFMRREASPSKLEVSLGLAPNGDTNWQAETVQWFPWQEDFEDEWSRTEETVTAIGDSMVIFIKGSHPYPEPGGALRLDSLRVLDLGPGDTP